MTAPQAGRTEASGEAEYENYNKGYDRVWGAHVRPPGVWFR
jgi:hypothetical protein